MTENYQTFASSLIPPKRGNFTVPVKWDPPKLGREGCLKFTGGYNKVKVCCYRVCARIFVHFFQNNLVHHHEISSDGFAVFPQESLVKSYSMKLENVKMF